MASYVYTTTDPAIAEAFRLFCEQRGLALRSMPRQPIADYCFAVVDPDGLLEDRIEAARIAVGTVVL